MKHKHSKSVCTMSPKRIVKILAYLREYAQQWSKAYEEIAEQVCHAFADTELKDGIGILEADCVDDWMDTNNPERCRYRAEDERDYWENVLFQGHRVGEIPRFNPCSAITFMDSIGRHFALPYYLLWALQDPENVVAEALANALENNYYTDELQLNAEQQLALLNAVGFLVEITANTYDDGYYSCINSPWQAAFEHLSQILSDADILPNKNKTFKRPSERTGVVFKE